MAGMLPEGRVPGIKDGRGEGGGAAGVGGVTMTIGRATEGCTAGLAPQLAVEGDEAGPRSMVISP